MNSFGRMFRISLFGESHGPELGVIIDGVTAGLPLTEHDFSADLHRRRPGSPGTTARRETDRIQLRSGHWNGHCTGGPLALAFDNQDTLSSDYTMCKDIPRPGHADFTARIKYGDHADFRGGGHFSGRLTLGLVAAGVVAKKMIDPVEVTARLIAVGGRKDMEAAVSQAEREGDSLGGLVECRSTGVPAGLGEPFFDSMESLLAHLLFAIPGIKGVEFGAGFNAASMKGSRYNDPIVAADGRTSSQNSGGISGGISNGNPLFFRVAARPSASISREQTSFDFQHRRPQTFRIGGRHDCCFALRLPVIVEAVTAIVLADLLLLEQGIPRRRETNRRRKIK